MVGAGCAPVADAFGPSLGVRERRAGIPVLPQFRSPRAERRVRLRHGSLWPRASHRLRRQLLAAGRPGTSRLVRPAREPGCRRDGGRQPRPRDLSELGRDRDPDGAHRRTGRHAALRIELLDQAPTGCQTVLNSVSAVISYGLWASCAKGSTAGARCTRFTFSAASSSTCARSSVGTPVTSIAFTSMWPASQDTSSFVSQVRTFTTPPGTSDVESTSASETAGSGLFSLAITTPVLPLTIAGASRDTRPSNDCSCGATMPTTPIDSGIVKLK